MLLIRGLILTLVVCSGISSCAQVYFGKPWNKKRQTIPGKIECEFYDLGGEGIAYYDKDSINNGSGKLNPKNGDFLNEFRMSEGVDISFTKPAPIDIHPFNQVAPVLDQLYVGWTEPGEWINYSIDVRHSGNYTISLMYTASGAGGVALLLDGNDLIGELVIPSTRSDHETVAWRQWHHWNIFRPTAYLKIEKGRHLLTLKTTAHGNMNYDYILFELK
ncbi:MAG: carbohydrate-binding protein [Chryseolinea sp.]